MEEKRRYPRIKAQVYFRYSDIGEVGVRFDGKSKDMAIGGMRIPSDIFIMPERIVELTIILPNSKEIRCSARTVWCERSTEGFGRYDVGIEFIHLKEEDIRVLKEFLLYVP